MNRTTQLTVLVATILLTFTVLAPAQGPKPFLGRWALTIPGGGAGWLGVESKDGYLDGSILWGGGSVVPVASVYVEGDTLYVTRQNRVERKVDGKVVRTHYFTETITATISGDTMKLSRTWPRPDGKGAVHQDFTGKRIPALGKKPDLSKARYGKEIDLFNGKNLKGWKLTNSRQKNGWSVENGVLKNTPTQPEGRHISYGNLRTVGEFEDFNLTLEVNIPKGGNSGIYLRGIYEVQVSDTYGRSLDSHHMGGIYSRISPTESAEKPTGQWQTMDITLLDRHVTIILNGKTIIDNQPLLGCTGGAMWSDESKPGPLYLQGDHTGINYRNMKLKPIIK